MRGTVIRWVVRPIGVVLVVVLAAVLVVRMYGAHRLAAAEREFRAKVGDVRGYASGTVFAEENAARYLRAAAEVVFVNDQSGQTRVGALTMSAESTWSEGDRAFLRDVLARNGAAIELLRRTAGMTHSDFGLDDESKGDEELKTHLPLLKLMWAQRLLWLDARVSLRDADRSRFLKDAAAMSVLATALERESPLIALLVGVACEKMFLATVEVAAGSPETDSATVAALRGMLGDTDLRAAWRRTLSVERSWPKAEQVPPFPEAEAGVIYTSVYAGVQRAERFVFGRLWFADQVAALTESIDIVDQPFGTDPPWSQTKTPTQTGGLFRNPAHAMPWLGNAGGRVQTALSQRNLARVALALRAKALDTGSYPASLVGTVDDPSRPDVFVGMPLTYLVRGDGSAEVGVPRGAELAEKLMAPIKNWSHYTWELPASSHRNGQVH